MFLPQQVIKKFIIFELITKTTPRPERKSCSILKAMAKEKRLSVLMRKSQSLTPGKNIVPLTLKVQLTLSKKAPLECRVLYPFLCFSSQETRGVS